MKKHLYSIGFAALVILLCSFSFASGGNLTAQERAELKIIKQDYRDFLIAQRQAADRLPTEAEEMKLVKEEYRQFQVAQRQTAPTEAEEMRLVKQEYRQFLIEQRRTEIEQLARSK